MLLGKSSVCRQLFATDKVQGWLVLTGLYMMMLLPVFMIFSRTAAEIGAGILILCFLAHSFRSKNWRWLWEIPVIFALILWLYSVFIVTPFALDPALSSRRIDWIRFIFLFAAIVYWLADYHEELKKIAFVILLVLVLSAADGIYQFITWASVRGTPYIGERLTGPFTKTILGTYLTKMTIPMLGILFYYARIEKNKWATAILACLLLYFFTVILVSGERTALLTFFLALVLVGAGVFFYFKKQRKPIVFMLSIVALIACYAYATQPTLQRRVYFTHEMFQDFSSSTYAQVWKASLIMWKEHPVTGVGMVNFRVACPPLMEQGKVTFCAEHSHNSYLEVLSEFGTLGLTLLISFIVSLVVLVLERQSTRPKEKIILTLFAFAGLLANFFPLSPTQSFFSNWPGLLAWQSIAWSIAILPGRRRAHDD